MQHFQRQVACAALGLLASIVCLLCACGESQVEGGTQARSGGSGAPEVRRRSERDGSAGARALRRALELGELTGIEALFEAARPSLGVEAELLAARLCALRRQDLQVSPLIENARAAAPADPRVYATAAELHAASGRLETAREELRRGVEACGMSPELLRAQGVLELCRQGGAARGLELVERALEYDPELPFTGRLKGQAHLLLGKRALAERRPAAALVHARQSLESDPGELDARLFFADCLAAAGELPSAVIVLEELEAEGHGRGAELALMYKRAALGELVLEQRDRALEYFRLAREAGLDDEQLGSGAGILRAAAEEAMRAGITAFEAGDLPTAELRFEHALRLDDSLLLVHSQLAVVLFQQKQFLPAATHWRRVLDEARAEELELPDPVHIYLAKALYAADAKSDARGVLQTYLAREPEGRWSEPTRVLLEELP
jgi:tetratricopeptide (TPR) repeat protein